MTKYILILLTILFIQSCVTQKEMTAEQMISKVQKEELIKRSELREIVKKASKTKSVLGIHRTKDIKGQFLYTSDAVKWKMAHNLKTQSYGNQSYVGMFIPANQTESNYDKSLVLSLINKRNLDRSLKSMNRKPSGDYIFDYSNLYGVYNMFSCDKIYLGPILHLKKHEELISSLSCARSNSRSEVVIYRVIDAGDYVYVASYLTALKNNPSKKELKNALSNLITKYSPVFLGRMTGVCEESKLSKNCKIIKKISSVLK